MEPYLFPFFFIGIWLFVGGFFALTSGWWSLAEQFRAGKRPEGKRILGQVKQIGIVPENHVTHIIASPAGLYLYVSFLFRVFHPPLLIPWAEVGPVRKIETLWWTTYKFDLASTTNIRVTKRAYQMMSEYLRSGS